MKEDKDNVLKRRLESAWDVPPMSRDSRARFIDKLERAEHSRHRRPWLYAGMFSAMAAVVISFVLLLVRPRTTVDDAPTQMELTIAEVKGYYKAKLWSESEYIIMLTESMDEDTREPLLQEVKKLKQGPDSLVERLLDEPVSDDMKIFYITQVYRSHLRSLQQIHSLLDERVAQK